MEKIKNTSIQDYQKEVDNVLTNVMGIGIDNYKKILSE